MSKYYFRAPTFDIAPDSPIAPKLGSIFSSLKRLTGPLNQYDPVPIPFDSKNENAIENFTNDIRKGATGQVGVTSNVLQGLMGSLDLIYGFKKDTKLVYHCEILDTQEFEPNKAYVTECIQASQQVQDFINEAFVGGKNVYMITGLKIATGFTIKESTDSQQGPKVKVGVDATAMGSPVGGGVQVDLKFNNTRYISGYSSKVVFAYRAIKISLRGDRMKYKDIGGGLYELDHENEDALEWDTENVDEQARLEDLPGTVGLPVVRESKVLSEVSI
jgi:hypothetical protein